MANGFDPDIEAAAEEYDAPIDVDVEDLMETPEGLVRVGDEFHDPDNWKECPGCGVDCPVDSTSCFNCGHEFDPETVEEIDFWGDAPVVGICERCGHEIHGSDSEGVGPVIGHVCEDGFRQHRNGEDIRRVDDS